MNSVNYLNYKKPDFGAETITKLLELKNVTINRIVSNSISDGAWYDQEEDEWLVLLQGGAVLFVEDEEITLKAGDTLLIPANQLHRVVSTSDNALWLTVHIA